MRKSLLPLAAATVIAVILILLGTDSPALALQAFFIAPLTNGYYLSTLISTASLLLLTGTGVSIAFSAGSFNLGGEGQSYAGGLAAALVIRWLAGNAPAGWIVILVFPLTLAAAVAASGIQGWIAGSLRDRLNIDPLISSFLLSAALLPLFDGLITGPLRDGSSNLLTMPAIPDGFRLPALASLPRLNMGIVLALALWFAVFLWFHHSRRGYELRMTGANPDFARFSGLPVSGLMILALTLSAVFHGLAGFIALTGVQHAAIVGFTSGLGWNGIAVSLVAGNRLKNMPFAALTFAYLLAASNAAMVYTNFSFELSSVIQAVVFLLISVNFAMMKIGPMKEKQSNYDHRTTGRGNEKQRRRS